MMRTFNWNLFTLLLLSLSLVGCSSAYKRSGSYVFKDGQWVFVHSNTGFLHMEPIDVERPVDSGRFMWPVPSSKRVSSMFGPRGSRHHDGVDIPALRGSSIVSSDNGEVIFSGNMRGYGRIVVVKHSDGYHTVYAHNEANLVKKGQKVSKGEVIAKVGSTGRSSGPHLHFEIRKNNQTRNPAAYLPAINRLATTR